MEKVRITYLCYETFSGLGDSAYSLHANFFQYPFASAVLLLTTGGCVWSEIGWEPASDDNRLTSACSYLKSALKRTNKDICNKIDRVTGDSHEGVQRHGDASDIHFVCFVT